MRRHRSDGNQALIAETFKAAGLLVKSTSQVGNGFGDLAVAYGSRVFLVEVKQPRGKLTADQIEFQRDGWPIHIVRTVDCGVWEDAETRQRENDADGKRSEPKRMPKCACEVC